MAHSYGSYPDSRPDRCRREWLLPDLGRVATRGCGPSLCAACSPKPHALRDGGAPPRAPDLHATCFRVAIGALSPARGRLAPRSRVLLRAPLGAEPHQDPRRVGMLHAGRVLAVARATRSLLLRARAPRRIAGPSQWEPRAARALRAECRGRGDEQRAET